MERRVENSSCASFSGARTTYENPHYQDVRDEEFWMQDGTVVISALDDSTYKRHLFRIHSSILSRQSPLFKNLFSLPISEENEVMDDCPIISVTDVPDDVKKFLGVLYDPSTLPFERYDPDTIRNISGPLKLVAKYKMDRLRNRIIQHLAGDWPCTLQGFDARESYLSSHPRPDPAELIKLMSDLEGCIPQETVHELLPTALYELVRTSWKRELSEETGMKVHLLDAADVRASLVARERIRERMKAFALFWVTLSVQERERCLRRDHSTPVTTKGACQGSITMYWMEVAIPSALRDGLDDPLRFLMDTFISEDAKAFMEGEYEVCTNCCEAIGGKMKREREKWWDSILMDHLRS